MTHWSDGMDKDFPKTDLLDSSEASLLMKTTEPVVANGTASPGYTVFIWSLLLLLVAGYAVFYHFMNRNDRLENMTGDRQQRVSAGLYLTGRYAVGVKNFKLVGGSPSGPEIMENLVDQIKIQVSTPMDHVFSISVIAELMNEEEALNYIDQLQKDIAINRVDVKDLEAFRIIYSRGSEMLENSEQQRLLEKYKWAAEIALTHRLPDHHPDRVQALKSAKRTLFLLILVTGFGLFLAFTGLILFVVAMIQILRKKIHIRMAADIKNGTSGKIAFLETLPVFLIAIAMLQILSGFIPGVMFWSLYSMVVLIVFWVRLDQG